MGLLQQSVPDERLLRRAEDTLEWYFRDAKAAQSGLRSSQGGVETALKLGAAGGGGSVIELDLRRLAQVRRARRVEQRLGRMDPYGAGVLATVYRGDLFVKAPAFGRAAGVGPDLASVHLEYARLHPETVAGVVDVAGWMVQISRRFVRNASGGKEKSFVRRTRHECLRIFCAALFDFLAA